VRRGEGALSVWAAAACVAIIVYSSLQPFTGWTWPASPRSWWLDFDVSRRFTRSDLWLNVIAYVPLGATLAVVGARWLNRWRAVLMAFAAGLLLSLSMELAQVALPPRVASLYDALFNGVGTLVGALVGAAVAPRLATLTALRQRLLTPGASADLQLVLLGLWLAAQINPAIPVFGAAFHPGAQAAYEPPIILIEAVQTASALIGIGLFADLMMRKRWLGGLALLTILALALVLKWAAAELLLKPHALALWLRPGHSLGLALGAMLLTALFWLPRQWKSIVAGIALLTSVLVYALVPDVLFAEVPLSIFALRFGHLLHLNGLTLAIAMIWPLLATLVLFWRFGTERSKRIDGGR